MSLLQSETVCFICTTDIEVGDRALPITSNCGHWGHASCLRTYLRKGFDKCFCNTDINEEHFTDFAQEHPSGPDVDLSVTSTTLLEPAPSTTPAAEVGAAPSTSAPTTTVAAGTYAVIELGDAPSTDPTVAAATDAVIELGDAPSTDPTVAAGTDAVIERGDAPSTDPTVAAGTDAASELGDAPSTDLPTTTVAAGTDSEVDAPTVSVASPVVTHGSQHVTFDDLRLFTSAVTSQIENLANTVNLVLQNTSTLPTDSVTTPEPESEGDHVPFIPASEASSLEHEGEPEDDPSSGSESAAPTSLRPKRNAGKPGRLKQTPPSGK
jgi:hypothetical protein